MPPRGGDTGSLCLTVEALRVLLAEGLWVSISLERFVTAKPREQKTGSPQSPYSQSRAGENSNYEVCY